MTSDKFIEEQVLRHRRPNTIRNDKNVLAKGSVKLLVVNIIILIKSYTFASLNVTLPFYQTEDPGTRDEKYLYD